MEWVSGNVLIRPNEHMAKGQVIDGHEHNFDHTSIVFTGAVSVVATGPDGQVKKGEFRAPAHFLVRADWTHKITALADDTTFWCVYAHRTPQGDVVQHYTGWPEAYR